MSRLILKNFISAAAIAGASLSFADGGTLAPVPEKVFAGCINGKVNIWVSETGSSTNHWFQMRLPHEGEDAWRTVVFNRLNNNRGDAGLAYYAPADFIGSAVFRVAETNALGDSAGWLTVGPLTNHVRHSGYIIGTNGNSFKTNINDGVVSSIFEANENYAGTPNPWNGIAFHSDKVVGKIRYAPRQSALGQSRIAGDVFEMADDEAFTNPVRIGDVVPDAVALGSIAEMTLAQPVTGRYFRIFHRAQKDSYLSIAELEFVPTTLQEKIAASVRPDDFTNMRCTVSWSLPASGCCVSGVIERAISPAGPFAEVTQWAQTGSSWTDKDAPVGITYYYRVKADCIGGGIEGLVYSETLAYTRSYRLERDPRDLTALKNGVSVLYPYRYMAIFYAGSLTAAKSAFDGDVSTYSEYSFTKDNVKYTNAAIGVDLGGSYHIAWSYVHPRVSEHTATIHERTRQMAVFGANTADLSDMRQISAQIGGLTDNGGNVFQFNAATNTVDAFRYVFLYCPTDYDTYGNVGEVGFYGFADQDIVDSGVLVPPVDVSAAAENTAVALTWKKGWNHASYAIERRKAGEKTWSRIASGISAGTLSYLDEDSTMRKGVYEYRVLAVSGDDEAYSVSSRCEFTPKRGLTIKIN